MAKDKTAENGNVTRRSTAFAVILFAVLLVVLIGLFHAFVFSDKMLYGSDTLTAGVFFRSFYVDYVHEHGSVPVWNPYQFAGIPYIDGFHGDTFYPFSILKFFINIYRALGWNLILHVFLAGITMFACARVFGRSQMASALAAVSYMFAAYFISQVAPGHDGKMYVTSLFPLTMMLIELAFRGRAHLYFALLGLVIGIIILTPHPQMAYYTLWACAFYVAFKLLFDYVDHKSLPRLVKPSAMFTAAVVIGLAISAIHFYSGYIYVQNYSPRTEEKRGMEWAKSWSLHWEEAASLVVPEFCGVSNETANSYWGKNAFKDNSEYAGAVPLLLALVALGLIRSRTTWFFGAVALFALIYGLAADTPFFYLFYYIIPNVKSTRAWSMIMFLFSFSMALLAAFGLDFIIEQSRRLKESRKRAFNLALFGLPALVLLGALFFATAPDAAIGLYKGIFYANIDPQKNLVLQNHLATISSGFWITFLFLAVTAAVCWLYSRKKVAVVALWIVVAMALVDAYRFDLRFIRTFDQQAMLPSNPNPIAQYFKSLPGKFRVLDISNRYLPTNYLPLFGIEEMTGFHGNEPRWYYQLLGGTTLRNSLNLNLMDMTNTRYIVVSPGSPVRGDQMAAAGFPEVKKWQNLQVFENPEANSRAYIVHEWIVDKDEANLDRLILQDAFNPKRQVGLFEDPGISPTTDSTLGPYERADIETYENGFISIKTTSRADGMLVLADNWYPAWKAFLDGREVKVYRANGAFRGIVLPAGRHTVEYKYISSTQKTGRLLTIAGLLAVAAVVIGSVVMKRKQRGINAVERDGGK